MFPDQFMQLDGLSETKLLTGIGHDRAHFVESAHSNFGPLDLSSRSDPVGRGVLPDPNGRHGEEVSSRHRSHWRTGVTFWKRLGRVIMCSQEATRLKHDQQSIFIEDILHNNVEVGRFGLRLRAWGRFSTLAHSA